MKTIKVNMNDKVRVKLNDAGRAIDKAEHDAIFNGKTAPSRAYHPSYNEGKDGWSEWQLWRLMELFGPHMHIGMNVPFETDIEICKPSA